MNQALNMYLQSNLPVKPKWDNMVQFAHDHKVPIMEPSSMHFLLQLLSLHGPKTILEIGTAIGYSACRMAEQLQDVNITTIERDPEMVEYASENIAFYGLKKKIKLMSGDALNIMQTLIDDNRHFDCIFIDAAKGQYIHFFRLAHQLLCDHGMIICDNVLFRGMVAEPDLGAESHPRLQKLAAKVREFNHWLMNHDSYDTSIVPIGDGLSVSLRRG